MASNHNSGTPEKKKMGWGMKLLIGFGVLIILGAIFGDDKNDPKEAGADSSGSEAAATTASKMAGIGDKVQTDYFSVSLNKAYITDKIETGNEFLDVKADQGNQFVVLNVTYKNTDDESRMLMEGNLYVVVDGKELTFDKSETVMMEGWGMLFDQVNPMVSKTTNLVYKIPSDITANIYWEPGRNSDNIRFEIGSVSPETGK